MVRQDAKGKRGDNSSAQIKLWSMGLLAVATLVFGVIWQVVSDRENTMDAARQNLAQLALTLEANTAGTIRSADLVADHVSSLMREYYQLDQMRADFPTADWSRILQNNELLHAISFLTPDGTVQRTVVRQDNGATEVIGDTFDGSQWSAFTAHMSGNDDLYVDSPILSTFVEGKWILPLTKAVRSQSGDLLGVVYVDIALDTFLDLFSEALKAGGSSVVLYHKDGRLLLSQPFQSARIGESFASTSLFSTYRPVSPSGTYEALTPVGRERRILSYRVLADWPLLFTIDLAVDDVLATWRQRASFYGLAAVGASTLIGLLTLVLSFQFRRDEANRQMLLVREQSLEESQRLAGVGHFERDILTGKITWADNMYALHGVLREAFLPTRDSFMKLVVAESRNEVRSQVHYYDNPPSNGHFECQIIRPVDNAMRDMVYDWQVIAGEDGTPIKTFGVARDVTDLKTSERIIRENEARLQDITECMSDFVWEVNDDGVLTYFESGAEDVQIEVELGVTKDGNVDFSAGGGDYEAISEAMAERRPFRNFVIPLRTTERTTRWIRISGNPRFDSEGRFLGFRGAGADITEQREQGIYEIEKAKSDALARLAGGMAHEINNLLQPVVVYSSMGENENPERAQSGGYFRKIFLASQQAISIVQDVLTFAREGRGSPEPLLLESALTESLDILEPILPQKIKITGPAPDVSVNVAANSGGLHQVMINLVQNAVDALDGQGLIAIDLGAASFNSTDASHRGIAPGDYGYFSVADNGPGLDKSVTEKVFDPFFSTKPTGKGTGLGLSVVAGLVKGWGGAMDVSSCPGQTVFTVYIPLVGAAQRAAE